MSVDDSDEVESSVLALWTEGELVGCIISGVRGWMVS